MKRVLGLNHWQVEHGYRSGKPARRRHAVRAQSTLSRQARHTSELHGSDDVQSRLPAHLQAMSQVCRLLHTQWIWWTLITKVRRLRYDQNESECFRKLVEDKFIKTTKKPSIRVTARASPSTVPAPQAVALHTSSGSARRTFGEGRRAQESPEWGWVTGSGSWWWRSVGSWCSSITELYTDKSDQHEGRGGLGPPPKAAE